MKLPVHCVCPIRKSASSNSNNEVSQCSTVHIACDLNVGTAQHDMYVWSLRNRQLPAPPPARSWQPGTSEVQVQTRLSVDSEYRGMRPLNTRYNRFTFH
jgi:hypothetical protein